MIAVSIEYRGVSRGFAGVGLEKEFDKPSKIKDLSNNQSVP